MNHNFDTDIATEFGLVQAILLNNLWFWVQKNEANENNYYDGYYWTYNSTKAFTLLFPYLTQRKIYNALKDLEDKQVLQTGNYNKSAYDRTKWYSFTKKGRCIMQKCKMEDAEMQNGTCENVTPIPDTNPVHKPNDKQDINLFFEELWKLYPNKKGKAQISDTKKKQLYKHKDQLKQALARYIDYVNGEEWLKFQNGSTWFNSGYVDYLDENYSEPVNLDARISELMIRTTNYDDIPAEDKQHITREMWYNKLNG